MRDKAMTAVRHLIGRVATDSAFSWHMLHTLGLELCLEAVAEQDGRQVEDLRAEVERTAASNGEIPELVLLRREVEQLRANRQERGDKAEATPAPVAPAPNTYIENLLWRAEIGETDLLTVENIRKAMSGKRVL